MTDPGEPTHWLERLREDAPETLAALFKEHESRLARMVSLRVGPHSSARVDPADVLQEAFIDAVQQVDAYVRSPKVAPYVWLRSMTQQRLLKVLRHHGAAKRRSVHREFCLPADSSADLAGRLAGTGTSPTCAARRNEIADRVERALNRLSEQDRDVILMRDFEAMSNHEIGEALGISDSGATMRYGRAICRLGEILQEDVSRGEI